MPRRRRAVVREVQPDPVFNSTLVERFVNSMMWQGKKTVAQGIFYDAMEKLRERTSDDPLKAFKKAVENAKPLLEVKTRRVGGANYCRIARHEEEECRWQNEAREHAKDPRPPRHDGGPRACGIARCD